MCSRHPEPGAGNPVEHRHAPEAMPVEDRGHVSCSACKCRWTMFDLSAPNAIDEWCSEPVAWHPRKCLCHSEPYAMAYIDRREQLMKELAA